MDIVQFLSEVGVPIGGAVIMGFFIFMVLKQILEGICDDIETLTNFTKMLEDRARVGCNELMKIDLLVSSALELTPDIDRIARAENFKEDGKLDVRRD